MVMNDYQKLGVFKWCKQFCSGSEDVEESSNEQIEIQSNAHGFL